MYTYIRDNQLILRCHSKKCNNAATVLYTWKNKNEEEKSNEKNSEHFLEKIMSIGPEKYIDLEHDLIPT